MFNLCNHNYILKKNVENLTVLITSPSVYQPESPVLTENKREIPLEAAKNNQAGVKLAVTSKLSAISTYLTT